MIENVIYYVFFGFGVKIFNKKKIRKCIINKIEDWD